MFCFLLQDISLEIGIKLQMVKELKKKMMWITKNKLIPIPYAQTFKSNSIFSHSYLKTVKELKKEIEESIERYMIDKEVGITYIKLQKEELQTRIEKELEKWLNLRKSEKTHFDFYTVTYNIDNIQISKELYHGKPISFLHFFTKNLTDRQKELAAQYCYIYLLKYAQQKTNQLRRIFFLDNIKKSKKSIQENYT